MSSCQQNACRIFWDFLPRLKIIQAADTTEPNPNPTAPPSHHLLPPPDPISARIQTVAQIVSKTVWPGWEWTLGWAYFFRVGVDIDVAMGLGLGLGLGMGFGPPSSTFREAFVWPEHSFLCFCSFTPAFSLQPVASCLRIPTPCGPKNFDAQRKRQQIIHHFAFRLRSVSFAKILGRGVGDCHAAFCQEESTSASINP